MPKKIIILICCCWLFQSSLPAQCPDAKYLSKRIDYLNKKTNLPAKTILAELLPYLANIDDCPYKNDSTHIQILRIIAREYSRMGDHLKAVDYEHEAIAIINSNIDKPSIKPVDLVNIYYFLSIFYDSLNNPREKRAAIDSCISIGMRLKSFSNYAFIRMIALVAQFNYDIGDYHRCVEDAIVCEKLASEYLTSTVPEDRNTVIALVSYSFGWHVKALLELNEYEEAENLIANKLEEYK